MALKVRVTQDRPFLRTIHLDGRLDTETAPVLDRELEKFASAPVDVLVFDLQNLEYISSAGLRSVFGARQFVAAGTGRIMLVNARPAVQKVFDIVKAVDIASVFTSVAELDRYLDHMQRRAVDGQ